MPHFINQWIESGGDAVFSETTDIFAIVYNALARTKVGYPICQDRSVHYRQHAELRALPLLKKGNIYKVQEYIKLSSHFCAISTPEANPDRIRSGTVNGTSSCKGEQYRMLEPTGCRSWYVAGHLHLRLRVRPQPISVDFHDAENRQCRMIIRHGDRQWLCIWYNIEEFCEKHQPTLAVAENRTSSSADSVVVSYIRAATALTKEIETWKI
ncbi:hypothetical protein TNCV_4146931 [Trichonephila clavipes]|nr:hypothetical protein TNCV_4146931 [Trichonephila clavipes]